MGALGHATWTRNGKNQVWDEFVPKHWTSDHKQQYVDIIEVCDRPRAGFRSLRYYGKNIFCQKKTPIDATRIKQDAPIAPQAAADSVRIFL